MRSGWPTTSHPFGKKAAGLNPSRRNPFGLPRPLERESGSKGCDLRAPSWVGLPDSILRLRGAWYDQRSTAGASGAGRRAMRAPQRRRRHRVPGRVPHQDRRRGAVRGAAARSRPMWRERSARPGQGRSQAVDGTAEDRSLAPVSADRCSSAPHPPQAPLGGARAPADERLTANEREVRAGARLRRPQGADTHGSAASPDVRPRGSRAGASSPTRLQDHV